MARILIDFVESDKKMIKTLQYFANLLISGLKSFKMHLYALIQNGKYPAIIVFDDRMLRYMIAAYQWTS